MASKDKKPSPKKKPAAKSSPQKNLLQKTEDLVSGGIKNVENAGKAVGAAYDKSQEARRGIWKNVKRPGKG